MEMDRPLHIPYNENSMVVDMDRLLHMPSNSKPHLSSAASENFRSACLNVMLAGLDLKSSTKETAFPNTN